MSDVITETPVTGLPGRTPRSEIEAPLTQGRKIEPVLLLDVSGSNNEPAEPGSSTTKADLIRSVVPLITGQLEADDAEAAGEQAGGSSDKGGLRTFSFNEPEDIEFDEGEDESDDYRDQGDLNSANVQEKLAGIRFEGRTYIMPAIHAAETAYEAEFHGDADRVLEMLVITDGKISDEGPFERWLAGASGNRVVAVAVIGYGAGHDDAVGHYQALAQRNSHLTVVALTGVSDPMEVAYDLRLLSGTSPK